MKRIKLLDIHHSAFRIQHSFTPSLTVGLAASNRNNTNPRRRFMKLTALVMLALMLVALNGCGGGAREAASSNATVTSAPNSTAGERAAGAAKSSEGQAVVQNVSPQQAGAAQTAPATA